MDMSKSILWIFRLLFVFLAIFSTSALAAYSLVSIDCPGAINTDTFGINNAGTVIGNCSDETGFIFRTFEYDSRKGTFVTVPPAPSADQTDATGINEKGEIVGFLLVGDDVTGFIRSSQGTYTTFTHPGSSFVEARANNDTGLVTGVYFDDIAGTVFGFIYNAKTNTFATPGDVVPNSTFTIAQGVNNKGDVVGNADLSAGVACTGCPAGTYGFLRDKSGNLTYFQVNGAPTSARGITDSGIIVGGIDFPDRPAVGFVTTLARSPQFQAISIPAAQLLSISGAFRTTPEAIANDGTIVGIWVDPDFNEHGFIATQH